MSKREGKLSNKAQLPNKLCPVCNKVFSWRKKWQRDWANVKFCSKRCRNNNT